MTSWLVAFVILTVVTGFLGLSGFAGTATAFAQVLAGLFLALAVMTALIMAFFSDRTGH